jgi:hypothetical protein
MGSRPTTPLACRNVTLTVTASDQDGSTSDSIRRLRRGDPLLNGSAAVGTVAPQAVAAPPPGIPA